MHKPVTKQGAVTRTVSQSWSKSVPLFRSCYLVRKRSAGQIQGRSANSGSSFGCISGSKKGQIHVSDEFVKEMPLLARFRNLGRKVYHFFGHAILAEIGQIRGT